MELSFNDAMFYKVLLQSGFKDYVDNWIDNFINNSTSLEGIYLELACCFGNLNNTISCLHNYIGENSINDIEVCTRLRNFIKEKLESNEITIKRATEALISFAGDRFDQKHWSDFYMVSIHEDFYLDDMLEKTEFYSMVREFINTGKRLDTEKFWSDRENKNKILRKKKNKFKILTTIVLTLYSVLITCLLILFIGLEKHLTGTVSYQSMGIYIAVVVLLIVPPVVICVVGWDMVYDYISIGKKKRRKIKEERKLIEAKRKKESDELRSKFYLSQDILTNYEYNCISMKKHSSKIKWILLAIFEILCLSMTIGSIFYYDLVPPEIGITIMFLGLSVGIYGFCILCDVPVKGIFYSLFPVLCYALPLALVYYILRIDTEWILGLSTILCGSILFYLFIHFVAIKPIKKKNVAVVKYWELTKEKYPNMKYPTDYFHTKNCLVFWKKDGTCVTVFEFEKDNSSIILTGTILFESVRLINVILDYIEIKDSFENCVKNGIELLEKDN